jgi:hypothetical protein
MDFIKTTIFYSSNLGSLNFKKNLRLWLFKYIQIKEPSVWVLWGEKHSKSKSHKNSPKPQKLGINSKPQKTNNLHERTGKELAVFLPDFLTFLFFENRGYIPKRII